VLLLLWVLAKVCVFYIFPWQTQEEKNVKKSGFWGFFLQLPDFQERVL
jgi:hypothetical protein